MKDEGEDDRRKIVMARLIRSQQDPGPLPHRNAVPTDECR